MSHSVEMEEAEEVLARAMVASITGNRPQVFAAEVSDLLISSLKLADGDFSVHTHHPEDFLILFNSRPTMRRLNGDHFINSPRFSLSVRPWSKLAHAGAGEFEYHVELELRGIPAQAWHLSTAGKLLNSLTRNWYNQSVYNFAIVIYMIPNILAALLFLLPQLQNIMEHSNWRAVILLMWWIQVSLSYL